MSSQGTTKAPASVTSELPAAPATQPPLRAPVTLTPRYEVSDHPEGLRNQYVNVKEFKNEYQKINRDLNAHMGFFTRNAGRILTGAGTMASVGGAVAMALVAPAALSGLLTGVGIPHGFAAAILGVGVGLAGIGLSIVAGALVRSMTRKSLKTHPQFEANVRTLKEIEATLAYQGALGRLDRGDRLLLQNTRKLLNKVDASYTASLRKQASNALTAPLTLTKKILESARSLGEKKDPAKPARVRKTFRSEGRKTNMGLRKTAPGASENDPAFFESVAERHLRDLQDKESYKR